MNCSNNNMTRLPDKLLPGTKQLIMTGNNLGILDTVHENVSEVNAFHFERSNISSIHKSALVILASNASTIKLSSNKITKLCPFITQISRTKLWLSDNPYACNCDMMRMRDWLLNATNVIDKENITCGTGKWKGKQPVVNQGCFDNRRRFRAEQFLGIFFWKCLYAVFLQH